MDFHAHIMLHEHYRGQITEETKVRARKYGGITGFTYHFPVEDLLEVYEKIFAGKKVTPVCFSWPRDEARDLKIGEANEYVNEAMSKHNVVGFAIPNIYMSKEELNGVIQRGRFKGLKPYLFYAFMKKGDEINIKDYLTNSMLEVAEENHLIIMLHIPKSTRRLSDSDNIREIHEISQKYPNLTFVLAHMGREPCPVPFRKGLNGVKDLENVYFDTCAVTETSVFKIALEEVPEKIVFATDMPFAICRGRRPCLNGVRMPYLYRHDHPWLEGLFTSEPGVKEELKLRRSGLSSIAREYYEKNFKDFTLITYETILSIKKAVEDLKLGGEVVDDIFYKTADKIFARHDVKIT